jgi:hypothetical protein
MSFKKPQAKSASLFSNWKKTILLTIISLLSPSSPSNNTLHPNPQPNTVPSPSLHPLRIRTPHQRIRWADNRTPPKLALALCFARTTLQRPLLHTARKIPVPAARDLALGVRVHVVQARGVCVQVQACGWLEEAVGCVEGENGGRRRRRCEAEFLSAAKGPDVGSHGLPRDGQAERGAGAG